MVAKIKEIGASIAEKLRYFEGAIKSEEGKRILSLTINNHSKFFNKRIIKNIENFT